MADRAYPGCRATLQPRPAVRVSNIPKHPEEPRRLEALEELAILDTESERSYDEVVRLVSAICETPIALVTFITENRQWFKAKVGLEQSETTLEAAFCTHCIADEALLEIPDTHNDPRFQRNPLVTGPPHIRFYAGAPIYCGKGLPLGSLCVIDRAPRSLSDAQRESLRILAHQTSELVELRRKSRLLHQRGEALSKSNERLRQILSVISHDLRSPFQGILGISETLLNEDGATSPEELRESLGMLHDSATETYGLLENLLEWSYAESESGEDGPEAETVYATKLVDGAVRPLQTLMRLKHIRFLRNVPGDLVVRADVRMLHSVLRNLVGNALKFVDTAGRIEVRVHHNDGEAHFAIIDNGKGISGEHAAEIREGIRADSGIGTKREKGAGLGLQLAQRFLQRHGTKLVIESGENAGTTMRFTLPVA